MATAGAVPISARKAKAYPGVSSSAGVPGPAGVPSFSKGRAVTRAGDLTIHRITDTHHGRTLLTLGHAAKYLADSRRFSTGKVDHASNVEAIHILMELSRSVFEDYAEPRTMNRRIQDWLVARAAGLLE